MKFKFDEQNAIERMIQCNFVDQDNITKTIYALAKYNFHVKNMNDKENYEFILTYITENCKHIVEAGIYMDIDSCIKSVKSKKMIAINEVPITKSELKFIDTLGDIKEQKATFVMLAVAKFVNIITGNEYDSAFMNHADICNMGRINIALDKRDEFMQYAYDKDVLYRHAKSGTNIKKLQFVSHDKNDPIVLNLTESDYTDLAYTYLAYLTPRQYRRCCICKKWMKINKTHNSRCCRQCSNKREEEKLSVKEQTCIDCNNMFTVDIHSSQKNRCDECYAIYRRKKKTETMRELRGKT